MRNQALLLLLLAVPAPLQADDPPAEAGTPLVHDRLRLELPGPWEIVEKEEGGQRIAAATPRSSKAIALFVFGAVDAKAAPLNRFLAAMVEGMARGSRVVEPGRAALGTTESGAVYASQDQVLQSGEKKVHLAVRVFVAGASFQTVGYYTESGEAAQEWFGKLDEALTRAQLILPEGRTEPFSCPTRMEAHIHYRFKRPSVWGAEKEDNKVGRFFARVRNFGAKPEDLRILVRRFDSVVGRGLPLLGRVAQAKLRPPGDRVYRLVPEKDGASRFSASSEGIFILGIYGEDGEKRREECASRQGDSKTYTADFEEEVAVGEPVYVRLLARRQGGRIVLHIDPPTENPAGEGRKLLASLDALDETLLGTTRFGAYVGRRNVGRVEFALEKAPEGAGGVYRSRMKTQFGQGEGASTTESEETLDSAFGLVSLKSSTVEVAGARRTEQSDRVEVSGEDWVLERTIASEKHLFRLRREPAVWGDLLLVRRLDLARPATLRVKALRLDSPGAGAAGEPGELRLCEMEATVLPKRAFTIRGREVEATPVELADGTSVWRFVLDDDRGILSFWQEGQPLYFVVGTEAGVSSDLEPAAGEEEIKSAVGVYLQARGGLVDSDALVPITHWESIQARFASFDPRIAEMEQTLFIERFPSVFDSARIELTPEKIAKLTATLAIRVEGEAVATIPAARLTFRFRRVDGKWKLASMPGVTPGE